MKKILLVVAVLALVILVAGCSSGGGDSEWPFGQAPWKGGDKLAYDIVDTSGDSLGSSEFSFAKEGNVWMLSASDHTAGLTQTAKVSVDASTLKPLGEEKTITAPRVDATITTTYKEGKLTIKAVQNGQEKSASIDVPANAIDNDQLLMTLRALPFADAYQFKFTTVVGQNASKIDSTATVAGKETVTVPAGTFEVWKVDLALLQTKQQAWYQTEAPYDLIQYDNGTTKLLLKNK